MLSCPMFLIATMNRNGNFGLAFSWGKKYSHTGCLTLKCAIVDEMGLRDGRIDYFVDFSLNAYSGARTSGAMGI